MFLPPKEKKAKDHFRTGAEVVQQKIRKEWTHLPHLTASGAFSYRKVLGGNKLDLASLKFIGRDREKTGQQQSR